MNTTGERIAEKHYDLQMRQWLGYDIPATWKTKLVTTADAEIAPLVEALRDIRRLLESLPVDCLGIGSDPSDGLTWPIRDEVIHDINKLLALTGQEPEEEAGLDEQPRDKTSRETIDASLGATQQGSGKADNTDAVHSSPHAETGEAIRKLLEVAVCPECDGSGQVSTPIGENFVSREMAIDAGDRSMEGQSMGIEYEHHECQFCHDRREMIALISSPTESPATVREQKSIADFDPSFPRKISDNLFESSTPVAVAATEETKTDEEIAEKVNQESGLDILTLVMDFQHGRATAGKTMDRIADRCDRFFVEGRALRQKPAAK